MPQLAAKTDVADRLERSVSDTMFRFEMVRALYSTPNSILAASIAAAAIMIVAAIRSGDASYGYFLTGFIIVGIWRVGTNQLYRYVDHDPENAAAVKRWEFSAVVGAWSFASLVGLVGAFTLLVHPGADVEILISCSVMGYIAGISSRNASRPFITIGQISLTCAPFTLALLWRADIVHVSLALFIGALCATTIIMCRAVFENIAYRHQAFRKIETLAHRDPLTDLWNRTAFLELLEKQFAAGAEARENVALVAIDLDRFKDINDTLGHPAGDAVLREAAERIRSAVDRSAEVSRIGGDEFLVLLAGVDLDEVDKTARHILEQFGNPFTINMTNSVCGASIGYAIAPDDAPTLDALMRNADLALYEAKKRGRGQIVPYTPALSQLYDSRVALEHDLQFALANGELDIAYQPIVDPRSGRAICCEALLRWNHPERGMVPPSTFIPIAEATGLIVPIGAWILARACAEATLWSPEIKVAVNLSPVQFRRGSEIIDVVARALDESGLDPSRLELEVTETVLIEDTATTLAVLEELRKKEIGISLDDFGTGFASLSYLNDFPFSKLKIDRKFSQHVDELTRTAAIISGIAQTTRDLRIELVAEGIETEKQLERMRAFGITAIQGYLFSKPLPVLQLRRVISEPIMPMLAKPRRVLEQGAARKAAS